MGYFFNDDHVEALEDRFGLHKLRKRKTSAGAGERGFGEFLKTFETVGSIGLMSFMNVKHAKPNRNAMELGGVPFDLTFGILGNVVALSNYVGEYSEHVHNVSNGLLGAYAARMGMMWGAEARAKIAIKVQASALSGAQQRAPQQQFQQLPQVGTLPQGMPQQNLREQVAPQYEWAA